MYKRIALKLSGETLAPAAGGACFDEERVNQTAEMLIKLQQSGVELVVIIGGGNIWRGRFSDKMNTVNADQMGMLATVINALCAQDAVTRLGGKAKVFTAQEMNRFADLYTRERALKAIEEGNMVFVAGGSGNPFFTTDTAVALRAAELDCDMIFKGTTVDGVYTCDPRKEENKGKAQFIPELTYKQALELGVGVMDETTFVICNKSGIPTRIFKMDDLGNILRAAQGEELGSIVHK